MISKKIKNFLMDQKIKSLVKKSFIFTSAATVVVGLCGIGSAQFLRHTYDKLYQSHGLGRFYISSLSSNFKEIKNILSDMYVDNGKLNYSDSVNKIDEIGNTIEENIQVYYSYVSEPSLTETLHELDVLLSQYVKTANDAARYIMNDNKHEAGKLLGEDLYTQSEEIAPVLNELLEWHDVNSELAYKNIDSIKNISLLVSLLIILIAVICCILESKKISNCINSPMENLLQGVEQMSTGDLNLKFNSDDKTEFGELSTALNKTLNSLNSTLRTVNSVANNVNIGSISMSQSSTLLAEGASEQASAVEQLSASVEQISAQVELNARNALKVSEFIEQTKKIAQEGDKQMKRMVEATEEIRKESINIRNIVDSIDEIAFQTNLLALNAAVEAARAGQYGKGFSVVADEVRNLAIRSSQAVNTTSELIKNSMQKAEDGAKIATETASYLTKIVSDVEEVSGLISNIARASDEQNTGIQQINIGISQVSDVVQTTSNTAEKASIESQTLAGLSSQLKNEVSKFKTS